MKMYKSNRKPDFNNLLKVLKRQSTERPTLFEFIINKPLCQKLARETLKDENDILALLRIMIKAFKNAGYDYVIIPPWITKIFSFPNIEFESKESRSLNEGRLISDRQSFEQYHWPNPNEADYDIFKLLSKEIPEGMKMITCAPGGVLENTIDLVGYENLCYMILGEPYLAKDIFEAVGSRLLQYYQHCSIYNSVGALIVNDDWGFKSQTMFAPDTLRAYVFPWHKKIVEFIHKQNKPAILHSCGNLDAVMDEVIDDMKFDGKHSFEDSIIPVEQAYEKWGDRIAILGGLDVDFLARSTPEQVSERARNILKLTKQKGGYALGSGNSIPEYVPYENYMAMMSVAGDW